MMRRSATVATMALLTAAALAAACNAREGRDATTGAQQADESSAGGVRAPLGTFTADARAAASASAATAGFDSRLPADPAHTILVPATTLYPGMERIEVRIENPYGDATGIAAGERHFAAFNCDGCHAPLGGGGMGPPLSDDMWIHGGEPAQIYLSIMHGRADGMPAWSSMLPGRTVWELVAYVQSLADIDDYARAKGFEPQSPFATSPATAAEGESTAETAAQ